MSVNLQTICTQAAPWLAIAAMGLSLFFLFPRYFVHTPPQLPHTQKPHRWHFLCQALLWFCISRLIIFLSIGLYAAIQGNLSRVLSSWESYWIRWDAPHYLGIAENGYVTQGDARFHIVFYPLYPLLVAAVRGIFGGHTALAACVVSNVCFLLAGWALAEAVSLRQGHRAGLRALRLMMLCPYSVFCSTAYTESLFLLLCALAVLMARREQFGWAVLFGALAANCRMPGILTAIPIFYEMLRKARAESLGWRYILLSVGKTCGVLLGLLAYVAVNHLVTGNPFQFMIYQKEHWGQQLGLVWDTFQYTTQNAFNYHEETWRLYTWIPQAICMTLIFALLVFSARRKAYPADGAFLWFYVCIALGTTWLLSGPRYLCGCYALYPILAARFRRKWTHWPLCASFAILLAALSIVYALYGNLL